MEQIPLINETCSYAYIYIYIYIYIYMIVHYSNYSDQLDQHIILLKIQRTLDIIRRFLNQNTVNRKVIYEFLYQMRVWNKRTIDISND